MSSKETKGGGINEEELRQQFAKKNSEDDNVQHRPLPGKAWINFKNGLNLKDAIGPENPRFVLEVPVDKVDDYKNKLKTPTKAAQSAANSLTIKKPELPSEKSIRPPEDVMSSLTERLDIEKLKPRTSQSPAATVDNMKSRTITGWGENAPVSTPPLAKQLSGGDYAGRQAVKKGANEESMITLRSEFVEPIGELDATKKAPSKVKTERMFHSSEISKIGMEKEDELPDKVVSTYSNDWQPVVIIDRVDPREFVRGDKKLIEAINKIFNGIFSGKESDIAITREGNNIRVSIILPKDARVNKIVLQAKVVNFATATGGEVAQDSKGFTVNFSYLDKLHSVIFSFSGSIFDHDVDDNKKQRGRNKPSGKS